MVDYLLDTNHASVFLVVLTADRHFPWVDGLKAENWLAQNLD